MTTTARDALAEAYDVVVVGYGPVGRLLALKLGERGHSVLVVERQRTTYFLPRAVHLDDEACRILQSVGASPSDLVDAIGPYDDFYEWRNADLETILRLDWRGRGPSGWNVSNFFNQPAVERILDAKVRALPTVTIAYGWLAASATDDGHQVRLELSSTEDAGDAAVDAQYVVGADGANSRVREWIGGPTTDLGYFHDWLVVDLIMKSDRVVFDPPAWQLCDPSRPTTLVPGGPGRRRFEFMRLPGESADELQSRDSVWKLLSGWDITEDDADLERHTLYTFQARWSDVWRRGRLLIAGDAAHLMPPFAGQGMCSGLRDAANLEWKLDLVLRGLADEGLLDTYGPERAEHVRHFIEASMSLGEVICISDPESASARDAMMRDEYLNGISQPPRPLPRLGAGLFEPESTGGLLSIQPMVGSKKGAGLLDDVTGAGGVLLVAVGSTDEHLEAELARVGIRVVRVGETETDDVADVDGELATWFAVYGAVAALVRPDFYVYGMATSAEGVPELAHRYLARLRAKALA